MNYLSVDLNKEITRNKNENTIVIAEDIFHLEQNVINKILSNVKK